MYNYLTLIISSFIYCENDLQLIFSHFQYQLLMYLNFSMQPCRLVMNFIHTILCWLYFVCHDSCVCSFHPIQSSLNALKSTDKKLCPQAGVFSNSFEYPCMQTLSDLHKKFQVLSIRESQVEYQIWSFFPCMYFLTYTDNRHTYTQTNY